MGANGHMEETALGALARAERKPRASESEHLQKCQPCADLLGYVRDAWMRTLPGASRAADAADPPACPAEEAIVAHVEAPRPEHAELVEQHLARCRDCAAEIEGLKRIARLEAPGAPSPVPAPPRALAERLRKLVSLERPPVLELSTRGSQGAAPAPLGEALRAFAEGPPRTSRRALEKLWRAGHRTHGIGLYLGSVYLALGRSEAAIEVLGEAARAEPKRAIYRWYLAQARLQAGDGPGAARELSRVAAQGGARARAARAQLARLEPLLEQAAGLELPPESEEEHDH